MAQDKQFDATPQRLRKARERGEVAHSRDFTAAGVLLLTMLAAPALVRGMAAALLRSSAQAFGHLHEPELSPAGLKLLAVQWGALLGTTLAPLLITTIAGVLVLSLLQTGPLLTTHPLVPKFDRLNPAQAVRRLFSWRGFAETLKSLLKLAIIALTAYLVLHQRGAELLSLGQAEIAAAVGCAGRLAWELGLKTALMLVILGAADYAYQRFEHTRSLRMTREEMRQETRESEGDPQTRGKRRQQRRQLLRDGIGRRLAEANVVVTNPTHYAVALHYRPGGMEAPVVVARGQGRLAARIKRLAHRYGIPVQENPPMARALYLACPLGATIPANLYRAVAVILAELHRQAARRKRRWLSPLGDATPGPRPGSS
jgi:flagellar biosynthetic protein FlhB